MLSRNYRHDGHRFDKNKPENNYKLTTFDQLGQQLRNLKSAGIDNAL
jgi:hypothetical protein